MRGENCGEKDVGDVDDDEWRIRVELEEHDERESGFFWGGGID